jgi:uncharacterized protein
VNLSVLPGEYVVCRLGPQADVPVVTDDTFFSVTRTADETSIVCVAEAAPDEVECEADWRILMVDGPLDFDLVGILAAVASPLAEAKISIFAISTFETDYVLVRGRDLDLAVETLVSAGHEVMTE